MADDAKTPDEPFLQRWARRKADVAGADPADEEPVIETASPAGAAPAPAAPDSDAEEPEIDLAALPDVESLDESSDFSVFMQNGIPEELRTRALQRLWRLDPSFGHIDGLLEYGEDFTGTGLAAEVVNTAYKVGKGMMSEETDPTDAETVAAPTDDDQADDASDNEATASAPLTEEDPGVEAASQEAEDERRKSG